MWQVILLVNSILLAIVSVFLVYAVGAALILGLWKQLLLVLFVFIFFALTEIALGAINS